jgi:hypothetical protein
MDRLLSAERAVGTCPAGMTASPSLRFAFQGRKEEVPVGAVGRETPLHPPRCEDSSCVFVSTLMVERYEADEGINWEKGRAV